ncbi:MAG: hypothetical protein Q8K75_08175 [Chlamydiales bacterium]|nr:hypothetical protein [Chlamydiales bacterium]
MAVTPVGNKPVILDLDLNTWTAQSTKEIAKLTNAGGVTNHFKAMGQVIKLQGGVIGDTAHFSMQAVKAILSLDMSLLIQNVKLALKHGAQAAVTPFGFPVPRLVLTTTQYWGIEGKERPKNWQDKAKALATQVRASGAEYAQKGVDLAKKVQANPNAMLAVKVGAGLAALGIGGLAVSRFVGGSTPPPIIPDVVTGWGAKEGLLGLTALGTVGLGAFITRNCYQGRGAFETAGRYNHRIEVAAATVGNFNIHSLNGTTGTQDTADGAVERLYIENDRGEQFTIFTKADGESGFMLNNEFVTGRIDQDSFVFKSPTDGKTVRVEIDREEEVAPDAHDADKITARADALYPLAEWVYNLANAKAQPTIDAQAALDDCDRDNDRAALVAARDAARNADPVAAQEALDDYDRDNNRAALVAARDAARNADPVAAQGALDDYDRDNNRALLVAALDAAQNADVDGTQQALDQYDAGRAALVAARDAARDAAQNTDVGAAQQALDTYRDNNGYAALVAAVANGEDDAQVNLDTFNNRKKVKGFTTAITRAETLAADLEAAEEALQQFNAGRVALVTARDDAAALANGLEAAQQALQQFNAGRVALVTARDDAQNLADGLNAAQQALADYDQTQARVDLVTARDDAQNLADGLNAAQLLLDGHDEARQLLVDALANAPGLAAGLQAAQQALDDHDQQRGVLVAALQRAQAATPNAIANKEIARVEFNKARVARGEDEIAA